MSNRKIIYDFKYFSTALGLSVYGVKSYNLQTNISSRYFTDSNKADTYCVNELFERRLSRNGKLSEIENFLLDQKDDMKSAIKKTSPFIIPLTTSMYDSPCEEDLIEGVAGEFFHHYSHHRPESAELYVTSRSSITCELLKSKFYSSLFAECYIRKLDQIFSLNLRELLSNGAQLKKAKLTGTIALIHHSQKRPIYYIANCSEEDHVDIIALPQFEFDVADRNVDSLIQKGLKIEFITYLTRVLTMLDSAKHTLDKNGIRGEFTIKYD